jgi:ABC-type branched-subunit amino acid transport system ATPase component/ABC-type branched-subunit amino acid transport system permease subunit
LKGAAKPLGMVLGGAFGLLWPVLGIFSASVESSFLGNAIVILIYAIIACSLVVLTGWVGQISLAQASFVGVGAFATGLVVRGFGIPFPLSLPFGAAITAVVAVALGVVALRVRGLYLAVATLIFAWMTDAYLFSQPWFVGPGGSSSIPNKPIGACSRGGVPCLDFFNSRTTFYYVALIAAGIVMLAAANLRDSKTGRAFFAVRGSEVAAASLGIDVVRTKLTAFAVSGFIAGIAGNLIITHSLVANPSSFEFRRSLFFLSIAVVGGLTSLGGALASAVLFGALEEIFFRVDIFQGFLEVISAALLGMVLLFFPGGLAAIPLRLAPRLRRRRERRLRTRTRAGTPTQPAEAAPREESASVAGAAHRPSLPPREQRTPVLEASSVTVRFGGLTAVDDASLEVREGEIVGLIGPNGAGKTTLFNAISGLNVPAGGTVALFGRDVTGLPVHARAALGMGRTFQVIQLFAALTVFDNLLVATHTRNPTRLLSHLAAGGRAVAEERAARERVRHVVGLLGLQDVGDRPVAGLPFGVLRLVEVARALVTGAPFVMLDEPASGLDNTETDRFADLLFWIRERLGVSLLLIEHDVRMVTGVSDYMYVLDRGSVIAQGMPAEVTRDPLVVAAYLGAAAPGSQARTGSFEPAGGAGSSNGAGAGRAASRR